MDEKQVVNVPKRNILHKLFGSTPGDGELQPKEGISYSLCGFGQNLICTIIGSYLTIFMTDAIGFGALSVAFLMLFARVYDAINDPIMGSIVDFTRSKWGKCRPYLRWMPIPIAIMTIICFLPWYPNNPGGFAAMSIMYVIWGMVYTIVDVPYWALSSAMSNDTYRRGNLLTIARLVCTLGAGAVTVFVPIITSNLTKVKNAQLSNLVINGGSQGEISALRLEISTELKWIYFVVAIVCVLLALPFFYLGFKNTVERNQSLEKPANLKHNLQLLGKNKPLLLIVLSGVLGSARTVFMAVGGLYFAKYVLADVNFIGLQGEGLYSIITLVGTPGGLLASVLVPYLTKKFGKRNSYIWTNIAGGVAMLIAFIVGISVDGGNYTNTAVLIVALLAMAVAGVPSGLVNIITYAMIGDTVEFLEWKTGERAEGICFAMQTFINKIALAAGAFIGVLAYYIANVEANNAAALDAAGKDTLWTMLMLVSAISFILSAVPMFFYKFNEKDQIKAANEIKERKQALMAESNENLQAIDISSDDNNNDALLNEKNLDETNK